MVSNDGYSCRFCRGGIEPNMEAALGYLTVPPLDITGCYSISFTTIDSYKVRIGFGVNRALSTSLHDSGDFWSMMAYLDKSFDGSPEEGRGTRVSTGKMDRHSTYGETMTLIYNPTQRTLHCAFGLEPPILLRNEIPAGNSNEGPLQPFVALMENGAYIKIVANPRLSLL